MKLRYLHISNYPPIQNMGVRFASGSPLQRECAIRFVIGVNGSGKSNLLRAVAEVFLGLVEQRVPQFPVSLIYELGTRGSSSHRTLVLDCPGNRNTASLWVAEEFIWPDDADTEQFEAMLGNLRQNIIPAGSSFSPLIAPGNWPTRASTPPQIALPKAVLAYTTGSMQPWETIWNPRRDSEGIEIVSQSEDYDVSLERPAGWTDALEMAFLLHDQKIPQSPNEISWSTELSNSETNSFRRPILLSPALLKCAILALTLPQALNDEVSSEPHLAEIHEFLNSDNKLSPLKELLARGGWHHLVSVAFKVHLKPKIWPPYITRIAHDWLLCAGEAITEQHPTELRRTIYFDLKGEFSGYAETLLTNDNLQISSTQGSALCALIGGHESTPFERFTKLLELHEAGLFQDVELHLRRNLKPADSTVEEPGNDPGVLRYEELSDGEKMVLGRMALFYLLEGENDVLLLLDEPETHFNDKWKREIVDIIDQAMRRTSNDILISTHSAIVLSDVFNDEIIMVEKSSNGSVIRAVNEQTFATDPSALMMTVFEADDSIGKRAQEFIEDKLSRVTGSPEEIIQLEQLIARMGSGFYRSELRTLLNQWKANNNA